MQRREWWAAFWGESNLQVNTGAVLAILGIVLVAAGGLLAIVTIVVYGFIWVKDPGPNLSGLIKALLALSGAGGLCGAGAYVSTMARRAKPAPPEEG